jgi:Putative Actinobacterial Holin-X, holin superfamily III
MSARADETVAGTLSLLSEITTGLGRLVKGELLLARAEAAEGLKTAGSGLAKIAVAAILALVGLNVLAGAAVAGLTAAGMHPAWAGVSVGLGLCLVAIALGMAGRAALRPRGLMPDRALRGFRRDADAVRQSLSGDGGQDAY